MIFFVAQKHNRYIMLPLHSVRCNPVSVCFPVFTVFFTFIRFSFYLILILAEFFLFLICCKSFQVSGNALSGLSCSCCNFADLQFFIKIQLLRFLFPVFHSVSFLLYLFVLIFLDMERLLQCCLFHPFTIAFNHF